MTVTPSLNPQPNIGRSDRPRAHYSDKRKEYLYFRFSPAPFSDAARLSPLDSPSQATIFTQKLFLFSESEDNVKKKKRSNPFQVLFFIVSICYICGN